MSTLPTGTVTFLFSDLEGSTQLWEDRPEEMRADLTRHDALLRAAITRNGGHVFKTVGDAFCAAFATAPSGLQAALHAQQALHAGPWAVGGRGLCARMALHTGEAQKRDGDYFGRALNRTARLRDAAHGGQTVLSQATEQLVRDALPAGARLRDLGPHRLPDLSRPEQVFQLQHPALPDDFPPLRSLDRFPNNLPQRWDSFVGRERDLAHVKRLLLTARLLTLTGVGGAGKTRLAQQAAAESLERHPDGVWLVALESLTDPMLVPQAAAAAVGLREQPGRPLTATLCEAFRAQSLLLLLDNCEHLIGACAHLAQTLLQSCPQVQILATSREPLAISGEATFPVPTLPQSASPRPAPPGGVEEPSEAVRLFVDRAALSLPSFALTAQNAPAITRICRQLDGLPLAIELAAPRIKTLTPDQISQRLDNRFRLLTGGSRTALPRQQTMQAAIQWSHDLLSEPERVLFRRLSVFSGGWTLEAAESVCSGDGLDEWDVVELLSSLVAKSLVQSDEDDGPGHRYRMLETLRHYSGELRLASPGSEAVRARHRDWFLGLAERAEAELNRPEQATWLDRLEAEHDNLRSALDLSLEQDREAASRMAGALWKFWWIRGYLSEGRNFLESALSHSGIGLTAYAKASAGAGILAEAQGDYATAVTHFENVLEASRSLGNTSGVAGALNNLGNVLSTQGDWPGARRYYEEGLALYRSLGNRSRAAILLMNTGIIANHQQDYPLAESLYQESLATFRALQDLGPLAAVLLNLGELACNQGNHGLAHDYLSESLTIAERLGEKERIASVLNMMACAMWPQGRHEQAARLFGAATGIFASLGVSLSPRDQAVYEASVVEVRAALGEQEFQEAWSRGVDLPLDQLVGDIRESSVCTKPAVTLPDICSTAPKRTPR